VILRAQGTHLPDDILIDDAIDEVVEILRRVSTARQRADEPVDWYTANIEAPLDLLSPVWVPLHRWGGAL
jgi:hypothetical protein